MERKQEVDLVLLNVKPPNANGTDAIAIKDGFIVALGTIPYVFSNYKGEEVFNGQGNRIFNSSEEVVDVAFLDTATTNIQVKDIANLYLVSKEQKLIAHWSGKNQLYLDDSLLDPEWDDH